MGSTGSKKKASRQEQKSIAERAREQAQRQGRALSINETPDEDIWAGYTPEPERFAPNPKDTDYLVDVLARKIVDNRRELYREASLPEGPMKRALFPTPVQRYQEADLQNDVNKFAKQAGLSEAEAKDVVARVKSTVDAYYKSRREQRAGRRGNGWFESW